MPKSRKRSKVKGRKKRNRKKPSLGTGWDYEAAFAEVERSPIYHLYWVLTDHGAPLFQAIPEEEIRSRLEKRFPEASLPSKEALFFAYTELAEFPFTCAQLVVDWYEEDHAVGYDEWPAMEMPKSFDKLFPFLEALGLIRWEGRERILFPMEPLYELLDPLRGSEDATVSILAEVACLYIEAILTGKDVFERIRELEPVIDTHAPWVLTPSFMEGREERLAQIS